jgi:AcrR family transcriptional regulator
MAFAIRTYSKNEKLVSLRRGQIARYAARLFVKNGYGRVNLRQIASACGMSIGNLYHYVGTKEDILYLVFDYVMSEVVEFIEAISPTYDALPPTESLRRAIDTYYRKVDDLQDSVVFMYQETKELQPDARKRVFELERRLSYVFESILDRGYASGEFKISGSPIIAQSIVILGQMWAFRRWLLGKYYVLEEYIKEQTNFILEGMCEGKGLEPGQDIGKSGLNWAD